MIHEPGKDWFRLYMYHSLSCASGCYLERFPPFEGCAHYVVDCWSRAQKMLKSKVLEVISSISEAFAMKCLNQISGTHFVDFWSRAQKILKSDLLGPILSTSGAKARKYLNWTSWEQFRRLLEPRPENV